MTTSKKYEAYGVKGMSSASWHREFRSYDEGEAWAEKNNAEIKGWREVETSAPAPIENTIMLPFQAELTSSILGILSAQGDTTLTNLVKALGEEVNGFWDVQDRQVSNVLDIMIAECRVQRIGRHFRKNPLLRTDAVPASTPTEGTVNPTLRSTCYEVRGPEGHFLMTAPMLVIASLFGLAQEAAHRALREIPSQGYSEMFFNGRGGTPMNLKSILILPSKETRLAENAAASTGGAK
jgi:hypothetical protein